MIRLAATTLFLLLAASPATLRPGAKYAVSGSGEPLLCKLLNSGTSTALAASTRV